MRLSVNPQKSAEAVESRAGACSRRQNLSLSFAALNSSLVRGSPLLSNLKIYATVGTALAAVLNVILYVIYCGQEQAPATTRNCVIANGINYFDETGTAKQKLHFQTQAPSDEGAVIFLLKND